jgi:hypothetical protein
MEENNMKYQHGDVLIKSFEGQLEGKIKKNNVIICSQSTNHKHQLVNGKFTLREKIKENELYLNVVSNFVDLIHEEHEKISIPKGKYKITFVREYDHFLEEARQVID